MTGLNKGLLGYFNDLSSRERSRFDPGVRHIAGVPMRRETLVEALAAHSCRRRHNLGLEILARTRGQAFLDTHALATRQRAVLGALPNLQLQRGLA